MFCPAMGDGTPAPCTATYQKWTGQPAQSAGSKNPLSLDMGSVKTTMDLYVHVTHEELVNEFEKFENLAI